MTGTHEYALILRTQHCVQEFCTRRHTNHRFIDQEHYSSSSSSCLCLCRRRKKSCHIKSDVIVLFDITYRRIIVHVTKRNDVVEFCRHDSHDFMLTLSCIRRQQNERFSVLEFLSYVFYNTCRCKKRKVRRILRSVSFIKIIER